MAGLYPRHRWLQAFPHTAAEAPLLRAARHSPARAGEDPCVAPVGVEMPLAAASWICPALAGRQARKFLEFHRTEPRLVSILPIP